MQKKDTTAINKEPIKGVIVPHNVFLYSSSFEILKNITIKIIIYNISFTFLFLFNYNIINNNLQVDKYIILYYNNIYSGLEKAFIGLNLQIYNCVEKKQYKRLKIVFYIAFLVLNIKLIIYNIIT